MITKEEARRAIRRAGATQEDAAQALGVSLRTISNWANHGARGPAEALLRRLLDPRGGPAGDASAPKKRTGRAFSTGPGPESGV